MLQYDDSAFYFFALSTISFYLIPSWYSILSRLYRAFAIKDDEIGAISRTSAEKAKAERLKRENKGLNALKSRGFLINFFITVAFTVLFVWLAVSVSTDGEVSSFDPFSILGIDSGADMKTIKRAYREMSLKYHPDKNPNNRAAAAKFMMVAKAYEALTDETAKSNWEKYGNPDGRQSLAVSIGLPTFLLDTKNRNLVLMAYLVIMVGVIPFCVWTYYTDSSKFGEKDVMYDTYSWYHHSLNEHTLTKSLPEIFAGSAEFRKRNLPSREEKEEIGQVMAQIRSLMLKPKFNHPVCVKGNVLLHAHLLRKTNLLGQKSLDDLKYMLRVSNSLIDAMISVCQYQDSLQTAMNCIEFGQFVTQAMWGRDSTLLQLPHFTPEEVKHAEKGKQKASNIIAYRNLPDENKKGMVTFTEQQKQDVFACLKTIPDITVETKVFVDDDEDDKVYEGDLCTVRVILTRNNLEEGQKAGLVHAPRFPFPRQEAWWIILGTKEGKIISIEKVTNPRRIVEHNIKFLAPRQGEYEFDLYVKSNAYVGLDQQHSVKLVTLDNSALPEYKVHPDDAELDDEPTLFEEMLNANIEQDSDSDDDDDDEEGDDDDDDEDDKKNTADKKKKKKDKADGGKESTPMMTAAEKKKARLLKARQQQAAGDDDDDDDDDDDAEEVYADK